jgi:CRISPR/Cas system-associated protein Cas10 (large subunit of type III CRISPR-Cas system)
MGFDVKAMTIIAFGNTIPMKHKNFYQNPFASLIEIVQSYDNFDDNDKISSSFHTATKTIKESTYEKADVKLVARQQKHLSLSQQDRLLTILQKRTKLFSGKLGHYTGKKMDSELIPGAVPVQ